MIKTMLKLFLWLAVLALFVYAFWFIYLRPETYELEVQNPVWEEVAPPANHYQDLEGKDKG